MSKKQKEPIVEHGYVIVDTNNRFTVNDTFYSNRAMVWQAMEGDHWTREQLKKRGFRCVKATLITEDC